VADVRLEDENSQPVISFNPAITLSMGITAHEINAMQKVDKSITDLIVIQIKPGKDNIWRALPKSMVDYAKYRILWIDN